MATVRKEFTSARSADEVWARLRRFDAVHELAPGFVTATKMEPSRARLVTFVNGMEIREWPVSSSDAERRLVYAIFCRTSWPGCRTPRWRRGRPLWRGR